MGRQSSHISWILTAYVEYFRGEGGGGRGEAKSIRKGRRGPLNLPRSRRLRKRFQSPSRKAESDWNPEASGVKPASRKRSIRQSTFRFGKRKWKKKRGRRFAKKRVGNFCEAREARRRRRRERLTPGSFPESIERFLNTVTGFGSR